MGTTTEYQVDLFALFMLLGIGQGIFLSVLFLLKRGDKSRSNTIFGLLLFSLSMIILEILLNYTRYMLNVMYLFSFANSLIFTIGPLLFLYIRRMLYGHTRNSLLHFIPFFIYFLYYLFYFNLQGDQLKFNAYNQWYDLGLPYFSDVARRDFWIVNSLGIQHYFTHLAAIHFSTYIILSLVTLTRYIKKSRDSFFSISSFQIRWLRNLVLAFIFFLLIAIIIALSVKIGTYNYVHSTYLACLMYFISFNYISNSIFFSGSNHGMTASIKYAKSSLSDELKQQLLEKINHLMEEEKLFKDNLLSLSSLAKRTGASSNHVSQVINECLNKSFYDFLASYRINEAKLIFQSDEHQNITIEQVAYEVGYNSKSAFNLAFKKLVGSSPSDYRRQIQ